MAKYDLDNFLYSWKKGRFEQVNHDPVSFWVAVAAFAPGTAAAMLALPLAHLYVATAVLFIGGTMLTMAVLKALMPKEPDHGSQANLKDAAAAQEIVYGKVRKGGIVTYLETTDDNQYLHEIVCLAGHEVEEIGDVYINDEIYQINSSGYVTDQKLVNGSYVTDNKWGYNSGATSNIRLLKHLGSPSTTASTNFEGTSLNLANTLHTESENSSMSSAFVGKSIAYLYARLEWDKDVFQSGMPTFTAVVKGKKVNDMSGNATTWPGSSNAALVARDYLTQEYGVYDESSSIDTTSFATAVTVCNTNSGSGAANKFEVNGVLSTSNTYVDNLSAIVASCGGSLFWGSGQWKLKAGAHTTYLKTLSLSDLRSDISLSTRISRRENFNEVQGTFSDSANDWIPTDYGKIKSTAFLNEDGGADKHKSTLDFPLPLTTNPATAQRLAKQTLFRTREQMSFTADFGLNAFDLEVGDLIRLSDFNSSDGTYRYGWGTLNSNTGKEFEIVNWKLVPNEEGDLVVNMTLRETSSDAFSWDGEETSILANNTDLGNFNSDLTVTSLSGTDDPKVQPDGTFVNQTKLSWTAPANKFVSKYEVQWKRTDSAVYSETSTPETTLEIGPLVVGVAYNVRVRASTFKGNVGAYASITHTVGGDTVSPAVPTSASVTAGYRVNTVNWTNPTDADFNKVQVWSHTSNSQASSSLVGDTSGTSFTHTGLSQNTTRYYWVRALDYTGNASAYVSAGSGTVLADPSAGGQGPQGPAGGSTDIIFKRSGSVLTSAPTGTANPPDSSWSTGTPSGTGILYASSGTTSSGTTTWTWGVPFQIEGNAVAEFALYSKNVATGTFSGVTYNFTTQEPENIPTSWSVSAPAITANNDIIYRVSGVSAGSHTDTAASTTITTTPVIYARRTDGAVGATGPANLIVTLNGADVPMGVDTATPPQQLDPTDSGTDNDDLNTAFVAANPLTDVDEIPENADIWCRFVKYGTSGDVIAFSYRRWDYTNQVWSSHGADFDAPIFAPIVFSNESFTQHLAADVIKADNLFIDGDVTFEEGGAWSVNKSNYSDTADGMWMGNPSGNEAFAFAASYNTGGANEHGVLFSETETKLINPVIKRGTSDTTSGSLSSNGSVSIPANATSITITAVGAGGGGAGARGLGNGTAGGSTSWATSPTIGSSTALGGAGGVGDGADKWRGDDGAASSVGAGGKTNHSQNADGNTAQTPALGAGGSGGAGRVPDWNTSSRKGGAGGSAGQTTINTYDLTSTGAFTLQPNTGSPGTGGTGYDTGNSYGDGGDGGAGTILYTYEVPSSSFADIYLSTVAPFADGQTWRNYVVNQAAVTGMGTRGLGTQYSYQNNTGRSIQVMLSISVSSSLHDGDVYAELSANNSAWVRHIHLSDSDSNEQMILIVPDGYYYRFPYDKATTSTMGGVYYWSELRDNNS